MRPCPLLATGAAALALFHFAAGSSQASVVYDVINLGTLGGATSFANAINAGGQIVGEAQTAGGETHATLFSGAGSGNTDLGTLGGAYSHADAINAGGQIVGYAQTAGGEDHATLFSGAGSGNTDLGILGGAYSRADAINAGGQIVGEAQTAGGEDHAFLYTAATGMIDLNTLLATTGWVITSAHAINDAGQIVGEGAFNGEPPRAVLLTPRNVPTPPPPATPPAAPVVKGKPKIAGNKARLKGKVAAGALVEYAIGKKTAKYRRAKTTGAKWKASIRVKPGRNIIYLRATDPATGLHSATKKIVIKRSRTLDDR